MTELKPNKNGIKPELDCISRQALKDLGAECIAKRDENGNLIPLGSIDSLLSVSCSESPIKWIPINEKLPDIHQDVLLSLRSLDIEVGFRAKTEPYFYCHGVNGYYIEPQNVLAWMPLPQPYKTESEE